MSAVAPRAAVYADADSVNAQCTPDQLARAIGAVKISARKYSCPKCAQLAGDGSGGTLVISDSDGRTRAYCSRCKLGGAPVEVGARLWAVSPTQAAARLGQSIDSASSPASESSTLLAALAYAERGWLVLPLFGIRESGRCECGAARCSSPGKHPRVSYSDATTDSQQITAWVNQWPDLNLAILTGPVSGLVVVDVDGERGAEELVRLGGRSEPTLIAVTGKGTHHYFAYPTDGTVQNRVRLRRDLDVRGDAGLVVVPPSRHVSGRRYQWENWGTPLLPLPPMLLDAIRRQSDESAPMQVLPDRIPAGQRNVTLTSLAGSMRRRGASADGIRAALRAENRRCDPPLEDAELGSIARSVARYPTAEDTERRASSPRAGWDPPAALDRVTTLPTFPVTALPDWMARFVSEEAEATQTPVDLAAMMALGALAATVGGKVELQVRPGYVEPLNLFVVVVLPPGNRKSSVFATMIRPIQEFETEERERLGPEIEAARSAFNIQQGELRKAEKDAAQAAVEQRAAHRKKAIELAQEFYGTPEPVTPRFITDDCTPEKLAALLHEQGGRMAVFSPEGDVFEIMAGRYSRHGAPNFAVFQKGHAGDGLYVDRIGRSTQLVPRPALTVALAVQPDVIQHLAAKPGFRGRGLLGRFLYAVPRSPLGHRAIRPAAATDDAWEEYRLGLRSLLRLPRLVAEEGGGRPQVLRLSECQLPPSIITIPSDGTG